ncbi:autophagy-related protein 22-like protein [Syncephalastrum racemosum]|uniref:Autophagy-related protein n=1 Tax=Syncephalastrum racemosum TaxID=13706 RepID=A0A1X2H226_SYNRA|nr:autophagy-related protein 22-like protein [Syncephalastrum racemosum]
MDLIRERILADPFKVAEEDDANYDDELLDKRIQRQPPATKKELWGYYLYYNGDNGYTIFSYIPTITQYLAYRGGFSPADGAPCDVNNATQPCNVHWMNVQGGIPVSSMMLYIQSIAFSIQFLLFTTFGSLADYGRWNRWILLGATVIGCASQIVPIALINDDGSHWGAMMAIQAVALISYGASLVFYAAAFPNLSDNLPAVRAAQANPKRTAKEKQQVSEKWRNHVSAISTTWSNIGFLILTALLSGVSFLDWSGRYAFPAGTDPMLGNAPVYNFISTAVCGVFWALNALPYFMFQPRGRQGPPLPKTENHLFIGWKSIFTAFTEIRKLKYLFLYIFSYFMFSDAVSTINQMSSIIQGEIVSFSAQQITIIGLITAVTSIIGCVGFLWVSRTFQIKTKTTLLTIVILTTVVPVWGCFGISMDNFGIKTKWELWAFSAWSGLFTAPIWAWQQTMLAELTPKGKENLFFGLFGVINKASSWIGPVVVGAISQSSGNVWMGWPFVLALFVVATIILFFIDVDAAKRDLAAYEQQYSLDVGDAAVVPSSGVDETVDELEKRN